MSEAAKTGLVYSDRYLQHNTNPYRLSTGKPLPFVEQIDHPSNERLVRRTKKLIDLTGLGHHLTSIEAYPVTVEDLTTVHTPEYVQRVADVCASGGGEAGAGAPVGPDSYEIALLSAGGVMASIDAVMDGTVRQAFALVRPPGHHAVADRGMGFCVFANVAVAANYARRRYGLERILIVDWDVHHGNGTNDAFLSDAGILFMSIHQDSLFPVGSGPAEQVGEGKAAGYTINIPLPAGSGDAAYAAVWDRIIEPIARQFSPQLVIISAGQDPSAMDPLGRMQVSSEGFRRMTSAAMRIAADNCDGRLVIAQEGGYSEIYAPYCTLAVVETLLGERTGIDEPMAVERVSSWPSSQRVSGDQEAAINRVVELQRPYWKL